MEDLHQPAEYQVRIFFIYNLSSICLAENSVFHARTKRIDVHYHYIREKVLEGEIEMVPTKIKERIGDILTKVFTRQSLRSSERHSILSGRQL
ncbi:hypothetical protein PAHAL_2G103900 [Panicum hallii]|jgi:hypothetical protein|uniref:Uncharacterized protein n=1 Tax=Panicum hallii TaxID=206008 RepID=A0A2T8KNN3_9POAL|nr:hypothetical protein PAHAL_2G103900 [Panicum hallii]